MGVSYTVKLPDGNEYGPVDLATLRSWHDEGRIGPDTLVWPEGSPEWLTLIDILAGGGLGGEADASVPIRLKPSDSSPPGRRAAALQPEAGAVPATAQAAPARVPSTRPAVRAAPAPSTGRRAPLIMALAVLLAAALAGLVLWLPHLQRQWSGQRIQGDAVGERRFADGAAGLALEVPTGWVLLRADSTLVVAPQSRAKLAHPGKAAFASLTLEALPPGRMTLDAFLDRIVDGRRALVSDFKELGRSDAKLGALPARRLTATWTEARTAERGVILVAQDGWNYAGLLAFGPASDPALEAEFDGLLRGLSLSGVQDARVREAATASALENPELSPASLELLVKDRLGNGGSVDEVPGVAIRAVSQGLAALTPEETRDLQQIYAKVYDPMSEADRVRLANYQRFMKAGQTLPAEEAEPLRLRLRDAILALSDDDRQRLQALNEKAIAASMALR
jgi:hypothetical protein